MKATFIVGTGRCGSTLLHEILAKHEDVSFFSNFEDNHKKLGFIGPYAGALYRNNHFSFSRVGKKRFAPSEAYQLIARKISPIYVRPYRDLTAEDLTPWMKKRFYDYFYKSYIRYGKPGFIHKYTGWSRLGFFAEIFPEAKFVHIVRDGRAVANSWLQMTWWGGYEGVDNWLWGPLSKEDYQEWENNNRSFVSLAGISWRMLMDSYEKASSELDQERYLQIKYEDFLTNPRDQMKKVLEFSGQEWDENFEKQFNRFEIRKSRERAFEDDLSPEQLEVLQNCLQEKLIKYGYS